MTGPMAGPVTEPDTAGVPFPPPLAYVAGLIAGAGIEFAAPTSAPTAITVVAIVAGVTAWLCLDGAATLSFRQAGTSMIPFNPSTALVTTGPYRFTRNPMYLGMACLYVALAFGLGVFWSLALLPMVLIAIDRLVIAREEPYLERRFGDAYRDYRARVRRWL